MPVPLFSFYGQQDGEGGSRLRGAGHRDFSPVAVYDALGDGKSQPISTTGTVSGGVRPIEPVK